MKKSLTSDKCFLYVENVSLLKSVLRACFMSLFLRLWMKGFSIGVATVYITEVIAVALEFCGLAELRYTPWLVP